MLLWVCANHGKMPPKSIHLKIGVEPIEGGGEKKLNVSGFLSYLDQEKFRLAETIYVPCAKAEKLLCCDVNAKMPPNERINTWTVADDERQH